MNAPTNKTRAQAAYAAMSAHAGAKGEEPDPDQIIDLLADLMHWCDQNETDFDRALSMATDHFSYERG
jgi:hypothetical protein